VEALKAMAGIAEHTEKSINYADLFRSGANGRDHTVMNAISRAAVSAAHELGAAAILAVTLSGATACNIAKYRPSCPIVACTPDASVVRKLKLIWGALPIKMDEQLETGALFTQAAELGARKAGLSKGDLVVIAAGLPLGAVGGTNMIKVHEIGESCTVF
jgi:pyruvate kinase